MHPHDRTAHTPGKARVGHIDAAQLVRRTEYTSHANAELSAARRARPISRRRNDVDIVGPPQVSLGWESVPQGKGTDRGTNSRMVF